MNINKMLQIAGINVKLLKESNWFKNLDIDMDDTPVEPVESDTSDSNAAMQQFVNLFNGLEKQFTLLNKTYISNPYPIDIMNLTDIYQFHNYPTKEIYEDDVIYRIYEVIVNGSQREDGTFEKYSLYEKYDKKTDNLIGIEYYYNSDGYYNIIPKRPPGFEDGFTIRETNPVTNDVTYEQFGNLADLNTMPMEIFYEETSLKVITYTDETYEENFNFITGTYEEILKDDQIILNSGSILELSVLKRLEQLPINPGMRSEYKRLIIQFRKNRNRAAKQKRKK